MSTRILDKSGVPSIYGTFYVLYDTQVANYSANNSLNLRTPYTCVFGNTPNVHVSWGLEFCQMMNYQTKVPENMAKIIMKCPRLSLVKAKDLEEVLECPRLSPEENKDLDEDPNITQKAKVHAKPVRQSPRLNN